MSGKTYVEYVLLVMIVFMTHALTWEMQDVRWEHEIRQFVKQTIEAKQAIAKSATESPAPETR